jgi:hypothetical protein
MPHYNLEEQDDAWILHIYKRVTGCKIGRDFDLIFADGEDPVYISIGGNFTFTSDRESADFVATQYTTLGPTLKIIDKVAESAVAFKDGRLIVNFATGETILTGPNPQFESWQISGRKNAELLIVCGPGGCLSIWHE